MKQTFTKLRMISKDSEERMTLLLFWKSCKDHGVWCQRDNRDFKIVDDGRLRRLNECHAMFHTFEMSPSELWDGVFSRGFSSW